MGEGRTDQGGDERDARKATTGEGREPTCSVSSEGGTAGLSRPQQAIHGWTPRDTPLEFTPSPASLVLQPKSSLCFACTETRVAVTYWLCRDRVCQPPCISGDLSLVLFAGKGALRRLDLAAEIKAVKPLLWLSVIHDSLLSPQDIATRWSKGGRGVQD